MPLYKRHVFGSPASQLFVQKSIQDNKKKNIISALGPIMQKSFPYHGVTMCLYIYNIYMHIYIYNKTISAKLIYYHLYFVKILDIYYTGVTDSRTHLFIYVEESIPGVLQSVAIIMMTSSNENIFRVTGPSCGAFIGHRLIPLTKASDAELWCFLWSAAEQTVK